MESTPNIKPLAQIKFRKFPKKVTQSKNLTDVKVMTPRPSVFDNFAGIIFFEEDEENFSEYNEQQKFMAVNDWLIWAKTLHRGTELKEVDRIILELIDTYECKFYKEYIS